MTYERVTWVNRDDLEVSLPKWQKMAANTDHVLAELEAVTVATFGYVPYVVRFHADHAFGLRAGHLHVGTVASVTTTAADYTILNGNIASLAEGQHSVAFNNLVTKIWKPEGMNRISAWFRARRTLTNDLFLDYATIMLHRNPM